MARDLPIGNGTLLINFDRQYQLRDLYFPHVGKENQSAGHPFRFGVWANGTFRWIDDDRWQRVMVYEADTLVTRTTLHHPDLPLAIVSNDAVDFHENLYLRRLAVTNQSDRPVDARFFFHHDFHIYETDVGDTAYYEPQRRVVFHYKDLRWFLINGWRGEQDHGVDQFATGQKEINGLQGTWRDAEDGVLGGNPISQGSVDSTIGLHLKLDPSGFGQLYYWIAAGQRFDDVTQINRLVVERGPATFVERTNHYWRLWARKDGNQFGDLPEEVGRLFSRSLLVLRTQLDSEGGVIAANDSDVIQFNRDTYSYVWPRDGALVANALSHAGYSVPSDCFFNFCANLLTKEGYFLHKYNPDGSLASSWHPWFDNSKPELPIQEDETGLVLWALWNHFEHFPEVEFIKPLYRDLIIRAADFMVKYRDPKTGLPLPSWDLWEERRGVLSWTVASVYAGLVAAARFANAFGEEDARDTYERAANEIKAGADAQLWHEEAGRFVRMIVPKGDGTFDVDWTIDSSVSGLFLFGLYPADDPRIVRTMESVRDRLWVKTDVGGLARYENDYYHQQSHDLANCPGNPWIICTLWLARWIIAKAENANDLKPALDLIEWTAKHALASGVLAEQVHPYTSEPLSVSPLTWSHGEVVVTIVEYLDKVSHLNLCPGCGHPLFLRERHRVRALRLMDNQLKQ
ncbi:MAG: glycoside hydrolase family 15 protein [Chloroflexota bacterium]